MTEDLTQNDEQLDAEFAALLENYLPGSTPRHNGALVDATVVGIVDDHVLLGFGAKEESPVPLREFLDPRGEPTVRAGDSVQALLLGYTKDGIPLLSYEKARGVVAAKMLEEAVAKNVPVRGIVSAIVKGGVIVDVGVQAFMPSSQVDIHRVQDMQGLVGQNIEAYVLDYDQRKGRAVLSRRKLMEERRQKSQQAFFEKVSAGDTIKGTVKDVLDFGVFVQLGDIEGLIPRSELSYDRGVSPKDVVTVGQEIEVKVLEVARDSGRLTLSRKRLGEDPWSRIDERYSVGTPVSGKVVSIQPFGAFIQLEEGITGLVRPADITWEATPPKPEEYFRIGDLITAQVIEVDKEKKRLALGLKHLTRDPWTNIVDTYTVGSRHTGTVTSVRDFGAFVKLDEYTEALLHIGDLTWTKRVKHPSEVVKEGDQIEVVILKLDRESRRIGVGIKQVNDSPFSKFCKEHPQGSIVQGKVTRIQPFGAFVELSEGLEGLIHISQLDDQRVDTPERVVKLGEEVTVKVIKIESGKERISLSIKDAKRDAEKENVRTFLRQEKDRAKEMMGGGFGSLLNQALKKK